MRITDSELQEHMFRSLGLTDEEIEAKFGFLVDAYHYGAPPHGGMGLGLDRLSMLLCGAGLPAGRHRFPEGPVGGRADERLPRPDRPGTAG